MSAGLSQVADLALRLHEERQLELSLGNPTGQPLSEIELPNGCRLESGALKFESLQARNTIAAAAVYERSFSSSDIDDDELFKRAYELWRDEIGCDDQASGRLLALASGRIDVLAAGARQIRSGSDVFDVLHLVEATLPYLEHLSTQSIIDLIAAKHEPTKNDMVAGRINGALELWLEQRPSIALELHQTVLKKLTEETSSLLGNALFALSKSDFAGSFEFASADAHSGVIMQAQVGTWTLGRLLLNAHEATHAMAPVIETLINLIQSEHPKVRSQAIKASVAAMHTTSAFDSILHGMAEGGDQEVLCAAASALFFESKKFASVASQKGGSGS